jgi:hypothetical protein
MQRPHRFPCALGGFLATDARPRLMFSYFVTCPTVWPMWARVVGQSHFLRQLSRWLHEPRPSDRLQIFGLQTPIVTLSLCWVPGEQQARVKRRAVRRVEPRARASKRECEGGRNSIRMNTADKERHIKKTAQHRSAPSSVSRIHWQRERHTPSITTPSRAAHAVTGARMQQHGRERGMKCEMTAGVPSPTAAREVTSAHAAVWCAGESSGSEEGIGRRQHPP